MDENTAYQQALDYLYGYVDYSLTHSSRYSPEQFDLSRMASLLELIGNPQLKYQVIHIAGTKGKGSVGAMTASALQAAGYRVGFYTSPHLQEYTERFRINGKEISKGEMAALVEQLKPYVEQVERLTTFEITTALGFLYFAQQAVDVAVIEVGLGGRLDATNLVQPLISVITSLSMDHTAFLGNTLEKIAAEKAGIIKTGRPIVLAPQKKEALEVVRQIANDHQSRLILVGDDYRFAPASHSLEKQTLWVWNADEQLKMDAYLEEGTCEGWSPVLLEIPLLGYHQVINAATAYVVLQAANAEGLKITDDEIKRGFSMVEWPGRFEILQTNPLIIIDSAHNPDSALKLRLAMDDYLDQKPIILLFGASADKDIEGMFTELLPRVERLIATQSYHPRAVNANELVTLAHRYGCHAQAIQPVEDALREAVRLAGSDKVVVAAGSVFIAAAVRAVWEQMLIEKSI